MAAAVPPPELPAGPEPPVPHVPDAEREALLDRVGDGRLTLVIGENDAGKTTFVRDLVNRFVMRGLRTALADADLGQSEVGPPTTIGLGEVVAPVGRAADAALIALRFVGVTSPARDLAGTVVGTRRLVDRALAMGFDRVVVDTSGLVRGDLGQRLKQAKIDLLAPDVVVALQQDGECEPILRPYTTAGRPRVIRAAPVTPRRRRTPEDRRRHRERALAAHLAHARFVVLDLGRVVLRHPALFVGAPLDGDDVDGAAAVIGQEVLWAERRAQEVAILTRAPIDEASARALSRALRASPLVRHALDDLVGMLAGLDDRGLDTLGLGVVTAFDPRRRRLSIETAVDPDRVACVTIGRERYHAPALPAAAAGGPIRPAG